MRTILSSLMIFGLSGLTLMAASKPSFDRYQVILDRKPFGDPPPPPKIVTKKPTKPFNPNVTFAKNYRMSSIKIIEGAGVSVGLVDIKTQASIILEVGQKDGTSGIELVEADYEKEEAVLKLGEELAKMQLMGDPQAIDPNASRKPARAPTRPTFAKSFTPKVTRSSRTTTNRKLPTPKYTGEELKKHLQDYNMQVIRQGLPPLPIALTPDQDQELVDEGVLPPQTEEEE